MVGFYERFQACDQRVFTVYLSGHKTVGSLLLVILKQLDRNYTVLGYAVFEPFLVSRTR